MKHLALKAKILHTLMIIVAGVIHIGYFLDITKMTTGEWWIFLFLNLVYIEITMINHVATGMVMDAHVRIMSYLASLGLAKEALDKIVERFEKKNGSKSDETN